MVKKQNVKSGHNNVDWTDVQKVEPVTKPTQPVQTPLIDTVVATGDELKTAVHKMNMSLNNVSAAYVKLAGSLISASRHLDSLTDRFDDAQKKLGYKQ